ncbi:MAG: glycosyltransferase, partial [Xanthomonadaceae bacterium]|nr:glycosyltransferase [Xanthomonadaceae bacterium]
MTEPHPSLSVILPVLNEAEGIRAVLQPLQSLRAIGHEVILVDGGSTDGSPELATELVDQVLHTSPGRAAQMRA